MGDLDLETSAKVAGILSTKLGISVEFRDIDIAHRMGRFLEEGNRPIICKFITRSKKFEVIKSRKKLKSSPIVIKEDLTRRNIQRVQEVKEVENVTESKKKSNDQELIQSDPISCPQNQKGNN